jgi:3-mercaptopyruvate sulfurtransferase SseA
LIEDLRPELEMAFFVIVYCNGGDCDDSIHLATDLSSLYGIPTENIYVYEGGLNQWVENQMPVTSGTERR